MQGITEGLTVLSLFDGISGGHLALDKAGIKVKRYFASEVDVNAIKVTQSNYPSTVQLGDVTKVSYKDGILHSENGSFNVGTIDLVIGGSPCQGFSSVGSLLNFEDERSRLFFEFVRILNEINPKYFLLENVKMKKEWQDIITDYLNYEPMLINSSLFTAQNRPRLYWTNIVFETDIVDRCVSLDTILEKEIHDRYYIANRKRSTAYVEKKYTEFINKHLYFPKMFNPYNCREVTHKSPALTAVGARISTSSTVLIKDLKGIRQLTPVEWEKLQGVPINYTATATDTARFNMLGNGWTIDVVAHIFSGLSKGENFK